MPNKHIDLFKEMIPAVDMGLKDLWDAASEEGQKEIKNDLWNLNRYISCVKSNNRELQEHFVLTVNEYYNKNWAQISKHPKLQWMTLCMAAHETKKTYFHEWIPLKRKAEGSNKKVKFLSQVYPNAKIDDLELLATLMDTKKLKQLAKDLGWDDKQINELKL
jgi:hypothetical protein